MCVDNKHHELRREFKRWQIEFMAPYREVYEADRALADPVKQTHRALKPVMMLWASIQELSTPEEREALMAELEQLASP